MDIDDMDINPLLLASQDLNVTLLELTCALVGCIQCLVSVHVELEPTDTSAVHCHCRWHCQSHCYDVGTTYS